MKIQTINISDNIKMLPSVCLFWLSSLSFKSLTWVAMTKISIKLTKIKIVDIINNYKRYLFLETVLLLFM